MTTREQQAEVLDELATWHQSWADANGKPEQAAYAASHQSKADALMAGAQALRERSALPDWLARLSEIEWAGTHRQGYRCCPVCYGTHPDGSIDLYGTGTRTNEGHRRDCWLSLALTNEDAPSLRERSAREELEALKAELKPHLKSGDVGCCWYCSRCWRHGSEEHEKTCAWTLIDARLKALSTPPQQTPDADPPTLSLVEQMLEDRVCALIVETSDENAVRRALARIARRLPSPPQTTQEPSR